MSYKVGQIIVGHVLNEDGDYVQVRGPFKFRTDDPEEYIQDIVIEVDGKSVYIDEQDAYPEKDDWLCG